MKTLTDGYFYIPTLGPFFGGETGPPKSLKVELLFDDPGLEGDQTGGTPPYPEMNTWPDAKVRIDDVNFIDDHYGEDEGYSTWDYMADVIPDKKVRIDDVRKASNNYGYDGSYITDLSGVTIEFDTGDVEEPDADGFVNIPDGATYFYVKKNGVSIGALITFWKEPLVTYTLSINVDKTRGYLGDTFTFYGTLTGDGTPVSGAKVTLYKEGVSTGLSDTTDADGNYSIPWQSDEIGSFEFYTEAVW